METKLRIDHELFEQLANHPPVWWTNLVNDKELYIDIRKDNSINVYHNGGSLMKLWWQQGSYKAQIHFEYIPLEKDENYVSFRFDGDGNIDFEKMSQISLNNFDRDSLNKIKKRISHFYPKNSEKGLQGTYVIKNRQSTRPSGFFIDTEFAYDRNRIDLIWVDVQKRKIALVELKTSNDARLYSSGISNQDVEAIDAQLTKYYDFVCRNTDDLLEYYDKVYQIKRKLALLPSFALEENLKGYRLIKKPILLVGDCTKEWITDNAEGENRINERLKDIAFGCVYQGKTSFDNFDIPYENRRNRYRFAENE